MLTLRRSQTLPQTATLSSLTLAAQRHWILETNCTHFAVARQSSAADQHLVVLVVVESVR